MRDNSLQSALYEPPQAEPQQAVAGRENGRGWAKNLKSLATGFIAGVAFWHLIGFWSFISQMAFNPDPVARRSAELVETPADRSEEMSAASRAPATKPANPSKPVGPEKAMAGAFDANCSALVLDRKARTVAAAPCLPSRLVLVDAGARGRQDLAVADLIERQLAERLGLSASRIETGSITAAD